MSEKKNRQAVNLTEAAVLENNWFFREQTVSDQGIDAHVETYELLPGKLGTDEVGTGRLLALQIKGGPHYFREPSPNGWWFRFKERKRKLWLGHALPVLVVLVDIAERKLYWQRVTPATVQKAGQSFKIEIPRDQTVSESDEAWVVLASGLEVQALAQYEYSLLGVPPGVSKSLRDREPAERPDAALLAMHLASGRNNPSGTVRALLDSRPLWITRNASWAWTAVAAYASDHNLPELSGPAYLLAAEAATEDDRKSQRLVAAAIHLRGIEQDRAIAALEEARALKTPNALYIAVGNTIFSTEPGVVAVWELDPYLLRPSSAIDESVMAQRLLAQRARQAGDLHAAVLHAQNAVTLDDQSTTSLEQLASYRLTRWGLEGSDTSDLTDAIAHLETMIELSRPWAGPTLSERQELAKAYTMCGRWESTLKLALPPPYGTADPAYLDPELVRYAALAARALGRLDVRDAACALLGDDVLDQLIRITVDAVSVDQATYLDLRDQALVEAVADERYEDVARYAVSVASAGKDVSERLQPFVDRGIIPLSVQQLAAALTRAHKNLDDALPVLRELSKADPMAAEHLISALEKAGRLQDAAAEAAALYDLTGSELYLLHRAECLIDSGGGQDAVEAAKEAVARTSLRPVERGRLLTFLGATAAEEQDWATAEFYLAQVLDLFEKAESGAVWRVIICLVNQGRIKKAAKVIATHRPEVRDREEAGLWLRAHSTLRWTERIALDAFALAERFVDDPELSAALLAQIVINTHGVSDGSEVDGAQQDGADELDEFDDAELETRRRLAQDAVPGELHRQVFAFMERLVALHGEATGIRVIKGDTTEDLVARTVEQLKASAETDQAIAPLFPMIRDSRIPLGFLAGVLRRGYATLVLQRAAGVLVASSPDDGEHAIEVEMATAALGTQVVVDASAVVTLTGLANSSELTGRFSALTTPPAAMHGLHRAAFDVRGLAGSPGSMRWDPEQEGIRVSELSTEEYGRLFDRTERVQSYADRVQVLTVTKRTILDAFGAEEPEQAEWADVLHLAAERDLAVWSDDLGFRRLARAAGLRAFGTPAVVDALRDLRIDGSASATEDTAAIQDAHEFQLELAKDMIVDLPLDSTDVLTLAEQDGWKPKTASAVIARPVWWANNSDGYATLRAIYAQARTNAAEDLPGWQLAAMYGGGRALTSEVAPGFLAIIALAGFDDAEPSDEVRLDGLVRARQVAADLGHPDPAAGLLAAAEVLHKAGKCADPEAVARRLLEQLESRESSRNGTKDEA